MTAIDIATGIIDKLQEENRVCLETLHKAQDTIKYSERQLADKNKLIKVLEERLRTGTDGILEMNNRQKDLTIRHLELQNKKLIEEKEDLEIRLEAIKAEICSKCETKLLLNEGKENKTAFKTYEPLGKGSSTEIEKKSSQINYPNRLNTLQKIVEHKDKRIMHLTKEVKRLTKVEDELTKKVHRLTKLMPISRLPPETVTECLLKEIQLLESEKQDFANSVENFHVTNKSNKAKKDYPPSSHLSVRKVYTSKSADSLKKPTAQNTKMSSISLPASGYPENTDKNSNENEILFKKLQKLCSDVNELKRLFAFESEKLSRGLNTAAKDYDVFKMHLEEIIDTLNDVAHNLLKNDVKLQEKNASNDSYVISCLQERLKESLGMITEYENENKSLKDSLNKLKAQQCTCSDFHQKYGWSSTSFNSDQIHNINDVKKLKEIIKLKESQLEAFQSHIKTCQNFIEELQKTSKHSILDKMSSFPDFDEEKKHKFWNEDHKLWQTKLDVSEKNIKTLENVVQDLQNSVRELEEENIRLETELHQAKSQVVSQAMNQQQCTCYSQKSLSDPHITILKKFNEELQLKVKNLEDTNSKLEAEFKLFEVKNNSLEQEKQLLNSKLEASEKQINSLKESVITLQHKLETSEFEIKKLKTELKNVTIENNLAEAYENDVMSLKNELHLKEKENRELKESLQTLEHSAIEMNHYRKSLHKEIETLCKALMENDNTEDSARRKAIYKAAVLHSAQALLRLDDNFNLKPDDSGRNSALEEMKHQIEVYLTEVSRIHELVTIKERERDELLKDYLDLPEDINLRPSPCFHHESIIQGQANEENLLSSPNLNCFKPSDLSMDKDFESPDQVGFSELQNLQKELVETKSVTNYLLANCAKLEDSLIRERDERSKCKRELEICQETVKNLRAQLNMRNNTTKRLNNLIEMMRSKECNNEITLEQMNNEIKWLAEENKKIFEKMTSTHSELCQCKEKNCQFQNELDSLKRQLLNEKYENAKINNELKHLQSQIFSNQSTLHED